MPRKLRPLPISASLVPTRLARPRHPLRVLLAVGLSLVVRGGFPAVGTAQPPATTNGPTVSSDRVADGFDFPSRDWAWWRGPFRDGTANPNQQPPIEFGEDHNVRWRAEVPGRGFGSPTVVGERVFLATADDSTGAQYLLAFDRKTGERLWTREIHASGGMQKNSKSTAASSTPACDGQRVFINFPNSDAIYTTAVSVDGEVLWQTKVGDYVIHQGYGASPALYQNLVIVSADNKGGGTLAALERSTGEVVWQRARPELPNYPSPILLRIAGRDQVVMVGCDQIVSYAPLTGETLWETAGATTECVTSTLTDGFHVFTSGGYPANHMSAIKADGSAALAWENSNRLYVPSLVIHDGFLYGVLDAGIAMCWEAASGAERWKTRLGGTFSSSPVLVGDQIFVSNEGGEFFVFRARPDRFESLAKNRMGDLVMATPTLCGSEIFHRVTRVSADGQSQEFLYCLANLQAGASESR